MSNQTPASADDDPRLDVAALARVADLPLTPARAAAVEAVLSVWWRDANELSRKMSAERHRALMPVTVFTPPHGAAEDSPQS
ncbi:MAG: hypothetical protein KKC79_19320 [Gammaproteobacteria bacterium]|nr:hypothetical protein [Gammaproteobacteria bacterium]MBU1439703.1 hypothetical protein [Gammaproteobacteria bacterium]MBU2286270.1 hypothetical protein [Gammaproteobacteria bacterium]MBU2410789.1 hypothetical protein [Gammaproteobacteria bacterium]